MENFEIPQEDQTNQNDDPSVSDAPMYAEAPQPPITPIGVGSESSLNGEFPQELRGWNWGAFLLTWIWSIANNTWIGLLTFLPILSLIMPFVLGAKGNEWAWKHRKFDSVEQFKAVQKAWAKWGCVLFLIEFIAIIVIGGIFSALVITQLDSARTKAQDSSRKSDITEITRGLEVYAIETKNNDKYPSSLDALVPSPFAKIPTDPETNQPYSYTSAGNTYTVCATLTDGQDFCQSSQSGSYQNNNYSPSTNDNQYSQ